MEPAFKAQPVEATETNTPTDSPTDTNTEKTEHPSQGGDTEATNSSTNTPSAEDTIPFHKHPRWIARQRELDEMRQQVADYKEFKKKFEEQQPANQTPAMPEWWKETFGTDEASQKAFQKQVMHEQQLYAEWEKKILDKVRSSEAEEAQKQAEAIKKYEEEIENNLLALTEKGYTFDRNELLKVVEEYSTDADGKFLGTLFPFEKAYEILQLKKSIPTPTDKARSKAAALSTTGTKSGSTNAAALPSITEIRQRGWNAWRNDTT